LTASLTTWPGDLEAWLALAAARAARGETAAALDAARRACELAPDSERALARLADVAVAAGEFDLSARTADRLVALSPTTVEHHLTAATSRLALRRWSEAEAAAKAALAIQPLHPRAHLYLAVARHHQGDPAGGRKAADTAAGLLTNSEQKTAYRDWFRERTR
jgi:cytochrome c-type biogenesis protein CcmH/NrfG